MRNFYTKVVDTYTVKRLLKKTDTVHSMISSQKGTVKI